MNEILSTVYVSQLSGCDSFSGYLPKPDKNGNGPYKTMERAIEAILECRRNGAEYPMTISLVDDYFTASTIKLLNVNDITIESYGTKKRIVGGYRIDNWTEDEMNGKKCLSALIPPDIKVDFNVFYVNGERADSTRFPETGRLKIIDADRALTGKHMHNEHMLSSSKWFKVSLDDLAGLEGIEGAMIHYYHFWIDEHSPIESYDSSSGMLTMTYSSRFSVSTNYDEDPNAAPLYYLTNIPNCFNSPGNWYLNRRTHRIYYIPKSDDVVVEEIDAIVPVINRILEISGEDVHIENLELTCTKGDYASTVRYPSTATDAQFFAADIQSCYTAPAAISFYHSKRCSISNSTLHGLGVYGIEILTNCHNIKIEDNHIYDICAGAVKISGGRSDEDIGLRTSDCVIRKNHIHGCGKRYLAGCGILVTDANTCEISENEIHDMEYSGISVGWVWGYGDSATYGNVITKNHIYDIGKGNLSDLGGIYLLGRQKGTVVSKNIIHDIRCAVYGAWGIYLDEGSSFITVEKNIVYDTERESFHLHYGSYNTVRDNLFLGKNSCVRIGKEESHIQLFVEGNLFITQGVPIYGELRGDPLNLHSNLNIFCDMNNDYPLLWRSDNGRVYDLEEWRKIFGNDKDSSIESVVADALCRYSLLKCPLDKDFDIKRIILEKIIADT